MADISLSPDEALGAVAENALIDRDLVAVLQEEPQSFGQQAWKRFIGHKLAIVGVVLFILMVIAFYIGPELRPYAFDERNIRERAQGPSTAHWFGTDDIGRDLFVRAMRGGQFSIRISVITGLLAAFLGGMLGAIAGFFAGISDTAVNFLINVLLTINSLAILLVLGVKYKITPLTMAVLLSVLIWTRGARVVRALVIQYKEREFVLAARAAGARSSRIIIRHLMPNIAGALLVEATLLAGTAIILESTLSFLGLGVLPPETTLGTLINDAKGSIDTRPYRVLIPGGIVTMIILSVNFIGDGLRDALDPTHELDA